MPLPLAHPPTQVSATTRILDAPRPLTFWHLASLDAPTVAVIWSIAFAWASHRLLPVAIAVLLFLVTWCIYATDRILDAYACLRGSFMVSIHERHYFHWRHRHFIAPLALAAACAAAILILKFMTGAMLERSLIVGAAALAYLAIDHIGQAVPHSSIESLRRITPKGFLVGVLFTAACVLPVWPGRQDSASLIRVWSFWIPGLYFAGLAWFNCACIAKWEAPAQGLGLELRHEPLASVPRQPNGFAAVCFAFAGIVLAAFAIAFTARGAALLACAALSALLLAILDGSRGRIAPLALRAGADLVLLTPAFLIPFMWIRR